MHVGFVALIGRPSTGKSTFLNTLLQQSVAIVSATPQSTRQRIRGIYNSEHAQIIFTDTPGIHYSDKRFNKHLLNQAKLGIEEADAILYLVDVTRKPGEEETFIISLLQDLSKPVWIALNKIDKRKSSFTAEYILFFNQLFPNAPLYKISSKENIGLAELTSSIIPSLPIGPRLYPSDMYTDQEPSLRIAEIIRKYAIQSLKEEIPHALYVYAEDLEMKGSRLWARIAIVVERETQKPIIIGKGGSNLQKIRIQSLKELSTIFPYKIELNLRVKVDKDWRTNEHRLSQLLP
ncbi:GTPase Era [Spirochaetales bacterium BR208]|uniref:GTPase Era n=1 Tax=Entomospira nematocerorum TaxID=2719987 RepID=A0A968GBM8_9SPIO|nr:GTPase Era [Entomospira nematocera]